MNDRLFLLLSTLLCVFRVGVLLHTPSRHSGCLIVSNSPAEYRHMNGIAWRLRSGRAFDDSVVFDEQQNLANRLNALHRSGDIRSTVDLFLRSTRHGIRSFDPIATNQSNPLLWETPLTYDRDRTSFNIGLQALLKANRRDDVIDILESIQLSGQKLAADTVRILISDAFARHDMDEAEKLFDKHFRSFDGLPPTIRSINLMMEGARAQGDSTKASFYFSLLSDYGIAPDTYTFSTLVRLARSAPDILDVVRQAAAGSALTAPFIRCAVESLGKAGSPAEAILIAMGMLRGNESVFVSSTSGDSLIAALLANESLPVKVDFNSSLIEHIQSLEGSIYHFPQFLDLLRGFDSAYAALSLVGAHVSPGVSKEAYFDNICCGSKGYCLLFAFFHSQQKQTKDSIAAREELLKRVARHLHEPLHSRRVLLLNGRLSDAILRSYSDNVVEAKRIWKSMLLPLARRADAQVPGAFLEVSHKSLEALMFNSGCCGRPDIGLDIAITARKRQWPRHVVARLARAYAHGKLVFNVRTQAKSLNLVANTLMRSLEISLNSELGAYEDIEYPVAWTKVKKIRLQFRNGIES